MPEYPDTRDSLLCSIRADDHLAWMEFTRIYETVIYRVATRTGLQHADALDVVQEVLAKVYRKIDKWDSSRKDGRFRNWIHRLTVNASIDVIRRRKRHVTATGDSGVQRLLDQAVSPDDETTLFRLEYRRALFNSAAEQVRADVSPKAWQAFWQTAVEERLADDVASELGLSVGAVYAHKCRVLARVRRHVQQNSTEAFVELEARP